MDLEAGSAIAAEQLPKQTQTTTTTTTTTNQQLDSKGFKRLLDSQSLVDCTLACDGGKISAHKIVLSICSSYLNKILQDHPVEHPIIILPELNIEDVRALVHYMYTGELLRSGGPAGPIHSSSLLKTAAFLSVNSLYDFLNNAAAAAAGLAGPPPPIHQLVNSQELPQQQQQLNQACLVGAGLLSTMSGSSSSGSSAANSPSFLPAGGLSSAAQAIQTAAASLLSGPFGPNLLDNLQASLQQQQQPFQAGNNQPETGGNLLLSAASLANLFPSQPMEQEQQITAKGHQQTINMSSSNMLVSASSTGSGGGNPNGKSEFQFRCPVCLEFFHTICSFEYHMQKSHNVTSFGCEICHKPFASLRYVLTDHMRRCHGWRPDQQQQQQQQSGQNAGNAGNGIAKF